MIYALFYEVTNEHLHTCLSTEDNARSNGGSHRCCPLVDYAIAKRPTAGKSSSNKNGQLEASGWPAHLVREHMREPKSKMVARLTIAIIVLVRVFFAIYMFYL